MRLVIISGLSGSGKSVALNVLEDAGFYCIDNIPVGLLQSFVEEIMPRRDQSYDNVGVGLDARNAPDIQGLPAVIDTARTKQARRTASTLSPPSCFGVSRRRRLATNLIFALHIAISERPSLDMP